MRRALRPLLAAVAVSAPLVPLACRDVGAALGTTRAEARAAADELFSALARRFGPHARDEDLLALRARVAQASFAPSRLFDNAAAWPESDGASRAATYAGSAPASGPYRLTLRRAAPPPSAPGDYRGHLTLDKLGDGEFEWNMRDELAVGRLRAGAAAAALTRALEAVEQAPPAQAAEALRAAFPRTAGALGRAVSLERLNLRRHEQGGAVALLGARLSTDALARAGFPGYARFLDTYALRLRFKLTAADAAGPFWQIDAHDGRLLVHFRSLRGDLVPLTGAPRPVPDALRLTIDFSTTTGFFRVGVSGLEAELRLVRAPREKSVEALFRREPEWRLPFVVRPFLRASLRRPFEGDGARLCYALREPAEGPTLLVREYRLAVRESRLVRWLGGLGTNAVVAFRRDAEEQADRFSFEVLDALRQDLLASIGG
jgi:hypothetical protein